MYDFIIIFAFVIALIIIHQLKIIVNFINRLDRTLEFQEEMIKAQLEKEKE